VDRCSLDLFAAVYQLFDGEQLAVLECEGDHARPASSVPVGRGDCGCGGVDCAVSPVHADHYRDGLSRVRGCRAVGVLVEQRAAAFHCCGSPIAIRASDKSTGRAVHIYFKGFKRI